MSPRAKFVYIPASIAIATGVTGGLVAGALVRRLWRRIDDTAQLTPDVLAAAGEQAVAFGLVTRALARRWVV